MHMRDPGMIDLDLMIRENNGRRTANMKTRNQKLFGTARDNNVPIKDYVTAGLIHDTNMQRPEHGIKNYAIQDSTLSAFYKIPSKSKAVFSTKTDNRNFIDEHVKNTKWVPPAKFSQHDWSSNFGKRGRWPKGNRVTSTQSEQDFAKKKNIPAPSHYKLKSQIEIDLKTVSHDAKSEKNCSIIE